MNTEALSLGNLINKQYIGMQKSIFKIILFIQYNFISSITFSDIPIMDILMTRNEVSDYCLQWLKLRKKC